MKKSPATAALSGSSGGASLVEEYTRERAATPKKRRRHGRGHPAAFVLNALRRNSVLQARWDIRHLDHVRPTVPTVAAEMDHAVGDDVVAGPIDRIARGVPDPLTGPPTIDIYRAFAAVLKTRRKRRLVQIAVEGPAIGQLVHLFARRTPMEIAANAAAKLCAVLAHQHALNRPLCRKP